MSFQEDTSKSFQNSKEKSRLATESKPTISDIVRTIENWLPETKKYLLTRGDEPELPLKRLPVLNKKLWGIHKQKLTVIAGRTSQGKSIAALNIAWDLATQNKKVFFISLEMSVNQMMERLFCLEHNIDNFEMLIGKLGRSEYIQKCWEKFETKCKGLPFLMSDMIGRNWNEVDKVITALGTKPDVVIVDHLQEITSKGMEKNVAIEEYLNHMRELAIRNNFAIVVCSQINRAGQGEKDRTPQLHQLKGSGAIEEKADVVMLLHWQHHYDENSDKNKLELHVAKNRFGATGYIDIKFIPEYSKLEDYGKTTNYKKPDVTDRMLGEHGEEDTVDTSIIQRRDSINQEVTEPSQIEWSE